MEKKTEILIWQGMFLACVVLVAVTLMVAGRAEGLRLACLEDFREHLFLQGVGHECEDEILAENIQYCCWASRENSILLEEVDCVGYYKYLQNLSSPASEEIEIVTLADCENNVYYLNQDDCFCPKDNWVGSFYGSFGGQITKWSCEWYQRDIKPECVELGYEFYREQPEYYSIKCPLNAKGIITCEEVECIGGWVVEYFRDLNEVLYTKCGEYPIVESCLRWSELN